MNIFYNRSPGTWFFSNVFFFHPKHLEEEVIIIDYAKEILLFLENISLHRISTKSPDKKVLE